MEIGMTGPPSKKMEELVAYAKSHHFSALQPLCMAQNLPENMTKARIKRIRKEADMDLYLHPPVFYLGYYNKDLRRAILKTYKQTVDLAEKVGAKGVLAHHIQLTPGWWSRFILKPKWKKPYFKRYQEDFDQLVEYGKRKQVLIIQEQLEGSTVKDVLRITKDKNTGVAYDIGHSFAESESVDKILKDLKKVGKKLVLLHSNSFPMYGIKDTKEIMDRKDVENIFSVLKDMDFQGAIIIEESEHKKILRTKKYLERRFKYI